MKRRPHPGAILLGDLVRDRVFLWVLCPSCGHKAKVDPAGLANLTGYDVPVPEVHRLLKCSRCRKRDPKVTIGSYPSGTEWR